ncbi:recombinase family protein [Tyzzerella sp. OttesenSCG-928-J15]|nr:recombinase family protein [Ruminococcaceae bacterium OttesenSCG-928-L11]MDL2248394.1 recombinase family protein [Tyzzerella sp. OttesenSCG-928-J15]
MSKYVIALYVRLSLEDSKVDSLSIHNQLLALHKYVDAMPESDNCEVLEFIDNGYTGTNFERPAMQELLEKVRALQINCIIVRDFSRFGRNSLESGYFIEQVFPLFKVRFISINDNFDTIRYKNDTGGMDVAFRYLINEQYSHDLSRKYKSAKYALMRRGEYHDKRTPYGYLPGEDKHFVPDEQTAPVVQMIFELALEGNSASMIARRLYDLGIPTPGEYKASRGDMTHDISRANGIWDKAIILRILRDERYTGTYIYGKSKVTEVGGNHVRRRDESEWFKIPDFHPAIISKETFQKTLEKFPPIVCNKKNIHMYPLRGMVFCGCCKHALIRQRKSPTFLCRYSARYEHMECHRMEILESELEQVVYSIVEKQAQIILGIDSLADASSLDIRLEQRAEYEKRLYALRNEKRRLYEEYLSKQITLEEYKAQKSIFDRDLDHMEQVHAKLSDDIELMQFSSSEHKKVRAIASDVTGTGKLTRELAELLIKKIYVYPDNRIEIDWAISGFAVTDVGGVKNAG